jgi:hypothetical protein
MGIPPIGRVLANETAAPDRQGRSNRGDAWAGSGRVTTAVYKPGTVEEFPRYDLMPPRPPIAGLGAPIIRVGDEDMNMAPGKILSATQMWDTYNNAVNAVQDGSEGRHKHPDSSRAQEYFRQLFKNLDGPRYSQKERNLMVEDFRTVAQTLRRIGQNIPGSVHVMAADYLEAAARSISTIGAWGN